MQIRAGGVGRPTFADHLLPEHRWQACMQCRGEFALQGCGQRRVVELLPGAMAAEHEGHEPRCAAKCAAIKDPLTDLPWTTIVEPEHREGRATCGG